jgi:hypothetical protein
VHGFTRYASYNDAMGLVLNTALFLLRRGPDLLEAGRAIGAARRGGDVRLGLPEGGGPAGAGSRIDALEETVARLVQERDALAESVETLSRETATLRDAIGGNRRALFRLTVLFAAIILAEMAVFSLILARFP